MIAETIDRTIVEIVMKLKLLGPVYQPTPRWDALMKCAESLREAKRLLAETEPEPEMEPQCIDGEGHDFVPWKTAPDGTLFYRCRKPGCKKQTE